MTNKIEVPKLVHFGDLNGGSLLQPYVIYSDDGTKPQGDNILWTSPKDNPNSFEEFVKREGMKHLEGKPRWLLQPSQDISIARVDSVGDYIRYLRPHHLRTRYGYKISWKSLADDFDAFWLTYEGFKALERARYYSPFNGWDCETVVIFNTQKVSVVN